MNNAKISILISLFQLINNKNNHYCTPSAAVLSSLLVKHHKLQIGRRWLFQCLADLESTGFITRKRRWKGRPGGAVSQIPGLCAISLKGAQFLFKKCVTGAGALVNRILSWLAGKDKRWPDSPSLAPPPAPLPREGGLTPLKFIFSAMGNA